MPRPLRNVAVSVRQRLLNLSKSTAVDYNQLLVRYALERLLYRLAQSPHRDRFVLKGAMLFAVWQGSPHRPTQDLDLLGFGERSPEGLADVFRDLCGLAVADDGLVLDPATVRAEEIRTTDEYGGVRVRLTAALGAAVLRVQVDVGFGDAVTPGPHEAVYPTLLGQPAPRLRVYPKETVVAEKLEAIAKLGMLNTRYKDYYDLHYLAGRFPFDGAELAGAIAATFSRRGTTISTTLPMGLTPAFAGDAARQTQWAAFRRRLALSTAPATLGEVVDAAAAFTGPPLLAAASGLPFRSAWLPPGPWSPPDS